MTMMFKHISMATLKTFPWNYVIYCTIALQCFSFGADLDNLLQIPTAVFVEDFKSYNNSINLFEQLVGKTISDVQYHFRCNVPVEHVKIQQPSTKEKVTKVRIVDERAGLVSMYLISTCNGTTFDSETKSEDGSLSFTTEMKTDVCLGTVLSDNNCSNASVPVDYTNLWKSLAAILWNNDVINMTDISFVTLVSPEAFDDRHLLVITEAETDMRVVVSDPSLYSTQGVEWRFSVPNVKYETMGPGPDGRIIYFNGTRLDITSPRIIGSYWPCKLRVKFNLRNEDVTLIMNVIQDDRVWAHRFTRTNSWSEDNVSIGQIDGIFRVQLQLYRIKQEKWRIGKLQSAVFQNCDLQTDNSEKPAPGLSLDTFVCKTGVIITSTQLCDFHNDCFHGDDESEEICGNGFSLGLCDFEEKINCSLILSDYIGSESTIKPANATVALSDSTFSLEGYVLAFEDRPSLGRTGFVTVNLTNPSSYLIINKSCVFQVDTFAYADFFRLNVEIVDAETEEVLKKEVENLKLYQWQKYRLSIPDFTERNVTSFYLKVFASLFQRDFLGFDNIFISPECIQKDPTETPLVEDQEISTFVMIVAASCASVAIIWITILIIIYRRYTQMPISGKTRKRLTLLGERRKSLKCVPYSAPLLRRLNENLWQDHPNYLMYKQILTQDLSDDIKNLSRYKLKLTKVLGSGAFGEVLQGQLIKGVTYRDVAVKRLSSGCSEKERTDFLVEALTMSKFQHDNIVCCLGIYVKNGALLLVEELMAGGDLKQFLIESRPTIDETPILNTDELLSLANDICQACSYLEEHKFIHRDIASRNCLLTSRNPDRVAKMADFGLARDIIQNDAYKKCGRSMLPVRWLPPESYLEGIFTTKSDVWAYGILLWEIFSFGYDPYPSMKCEEMMAKVNGGQRMAAPPRCPTVVYDVMMLCWQHDPKSRPSFARLCEYLQKIRKNVCIDLVDNIDISGDEKEDDIDNSNEDSRLHTWHYNGNYAVEEDSV